MKVVKRIVVWGALVTAVALFLACPPNGLLSDIEQKVQDVTAQYSLTVNATNGGIVSPSGLTKVKLGAATTITAFPNGGFSFVNWTVASGSGANIGNAASTSTTVTLASGDVTIQANFAQIFCQLTLQSGANGTITAPTSSQITVAAGALTTITASPNGGYYFSSWTVISGTGVSFGNASSASTTVALTGGKATIQANFTNIQYQLTVNAAPSGDGATTPSGQTTVSYGAPVTITASPSTSYGFVNWTVVSGTGVTFGSTGTATSTTTPDTVTLKNGDATIQANFILAQYTLTLSAGSGGTITTPSSSSVTVTSGVQTNIVAAPNTGYNFSSWQVASGTGVSFGSQTSASTTVTLTGGNATIQANFSLAQYTLTVTAYSGGSITTPSSSPVTVNYGAATTIVATPNTGYALLYWTGVGSGVTIGNPNSASTTVTLKGGNATIYASFIPWDAYGTKGSGTGMFNDPFAIAVDSSTGYIYIADTGNNRIVRMNDMTGSGWTTYGSSGSGTGNFSSPDGIAIDSTHGYIYVADNGNCRIVRLTNMSGGGWTTYGTGGSGVGNFAYPGGIAVDYSGNIYVSDGGNSRIVCITDMLGSGWNVFKPTGAEAYNGVWGVSVYSKIYAADMGNSRITGMDNISGAGWTAYTGLSGQTFWHPSGVATDSSQKIYVADSGNNRIVRMTNMSGGGWTTYGNFYCPTGICTYNGYIYVADELYNRIVRLQLP